ncbi:MAG: DNA polymerase [Actinomycetota bacterium]
MNTSPVDRPLVAVAASPAIGVGLATVDHRWSAPFEELATIVEELTATRDPRWVWWDANAAGVLVRAGVVIDRCWDVAAVHRLLRGGWRASPAEVWADLHGLSTDTIPTLGQLDLLQAQTDEGDDPEAPIRPDGHLRPEWTGGGWAKSETRLADWAGLALVAADGQQRRIAERADARRVQSTARSESAAELLCAELAADGLPIDVAEAERIIEAAAGPRTATVGEEEAARARRDAPVLDALAATAAVNLRNPADVKAMLRREGIDVADTRAWRLRERRDEHPVIDALLRWRKDERIATTYGYRWLGDHVSDGRLRGDWSSSDGAAGRMTASAGLHNLPAEMRSAVAAERGHILIRADLGQVEPRVLAAVSGDRALIAATGDDDLYRRIADQLGVDRDEAKLAVLGAMYGATTGQSAHALPGLRRNYPQAMALLERLADEGRRGADVTTVGGRRIRTGGGPGRDGDLDRARAAAEARGRFARNAAIQGAAAEFFKVWAITVRRRVRPMAARIVLCLHDELLVHGPEARADELAGAVIAAIDEAAHYWSPEPAVRFVADASVIRRWSEAKP